MDWQANQLDVRFNVLYGGYDFIVLQHIAHPFPGQDNLIESAAKLMPYVQHSDSKPLLYLPWSEKNNPDGQAVIVQAHEALLARYPGMQWRPSAWCGTRCATDIPKSSSTITMGNTLRPSAPT